MSQGEGTDFMEFDGLDQLFESDIDLSAAHGDKFSSSGNDKGRDLSFFRAIPVKVTLEVASAEVVLGDLMQAEIGSVIELDKMAGEPLDVRVNGRLLARGEVVVVNGKYGLRMVELIDTDMMGSKNE